MEGGWGSGELQYPIEDGLHLLSTQARYQHVDLRCKLLCIDAYGLRTKLPGEEGWTFGAARVMGRTKQQSQIGGADCPGKFGTHTPPARNLSARTGPTLNRPDEKFENSGKKK